MDSIIVILYIYETYLTLTVHCDASIVRQENESSFEDVDHKSVSGLIDNRVQRSPNLFKKVRLMQKGLPLH